MIKKIFLTCLFSFLIMTSFLSLANGQPVIRVATEYYPPYVGPDLKQYGLLARIVTEAFEFEGIKVEFGFFPDKQAYKLAKRGEYDATMPWARRQERLPFFYYGEPVIESDREVFFFRSGFKFQWDPKKQNYEDIRGVNVGAIIGSNYGPRFMEAEKNKIINVSRVASAKQNFRMLSSGRIDLMISPERIAVYVLKTQIDQKTAIKLESTLAIDEPVEYDYLLISKKSENGGFFLSAMNRGLLKLKKTGRHRQMLDQFFKEFDSLTQSEVK